MVVKGTHEPIIDPEAFQKVQLLVNSRKHTRSRTYDFLLKGLIFCHECGYPMAVLNRKNAAGEDRLFFGCRAYLHPDKLCPIAKEAVENASKAASCGSDVYGPAERSALGRGLPAHLSEGQNGSHGSGRSAEELAKQPVNTEEKARALVKQFLDSALTSRELLVSLIERVELTEEKEIIIKFRFHELEAIS